MAIFPGAVKVDCANNGNGAWIGAMDFVQACFPEYGYFCAGVLSITQVSLADGKR
jgi:hypothetical protein